MCHDFGAMTLHFFLIIIWNSHKLQSFEQIKYLDTCCSINSLVESNDKE